MVQRLQRFGSYNRFKQARSSSHGVLPAMLSLESSIVHVVVTPGQAGDVCMPSDNWLLGMQVVLQALVAEVQATEEFLIPPQLHAGVSTSVCHEHTRLLAAFAMC
jgi:hypothetical protein